MAAKFSVLLNSKDKNVTNQEEVVGEVVVATRSSSLTAFLSMMSIVLLRATQLPLRASTA